MSKSSSQRRPVFSHSLIAFSVSLPFLGLLADSAYAADQSQLVELNNQACILMQSNQFLPAIQKLETALKLDPTYERARENLAAARNNYGLQLKNPVEAIKQFHQAVYLDPKTHSSVDNLDATISMMGKNPKSLADRMALGKQARTALDFAGAIVEYQAAARLKDDPSLHVILGDVYRVLDEKDKAIAEYQIAVNSADSADVEVKLGQAYQAKKDIPNAITAFGKAIAFKSDDPEVQNALVAGWEEALKENPLAPDNHIGLGQALQYRGDFGQAQEEFNQAIRLSPGKQNAIASRLMNAMPEAKRQAEFSKHVNLGVDLQSKKQYDEAIAEYKLALQINAKSDEVWVNIGTAYQAKGDYDSAVAAYNQALKINGSNQAAKQGIETAKSEQKDKTITASYDDAGKQFKQGNYDGAIAKYLDVLKLNANNPATLFSLGASYQAKKDFDNAIASYQKAIAADPQNADYQKALAGALELKAAPIIAAAVEKHKAKDYDSAIAGYTQALAITPNNAALWYNIASAEYAKQEYKRAKDAYMHALQIDAKGQVADWYLNGVIEENYGHGTEAQKDYQKYLQLAPNGTYAAAANERSAALKKNINDTVKIKSESQVAQEKDADDAYQQAVKLQEAKHYDPAIPLYLKAISLQPDNVDSVFALGTLYQAMGNFKEAAVQYRKAIALAPTNKDLLKYLAQVTGLDQSKTAQEAYDAAVKAQTAGNLDEALSQYDKAIKTEPNEPSYFYSRGTAYQAKKDLDKAIEDYRKAGAMNPKEPVYKQVLNAALQAKAAPLAESAIKKQTGTPPDLNGAILDYLEALKICDDPVIHTNLGTCLQAQDQLYEALKHYDKAIALDPKGSADAMYYSGIINEKLKHIAPALKRYQDYIKEAPTGQFVEDAKVRVKMLVGH